MKIMLKIVLFVVFFENSNQIFDTLREKLFNYTEKIEDIFDGPAVVLTKIQNNLIKSMKSFAIIEPTERETRLVDEDMNYLFSIGTDKLIDSNTKMDFFCSERNNFLEELKTWITRKYTFHYRLRFIVILMIHKIKTKNNDFCADNKSKEDFLKFTQLLVPMNPTLMTIRFRFIDTLVAIKKSHFGITRVGKICCAYWRFKHQTLDTIDSIELKEFVSQMMNSYFSGGLHYFCLIYQENWQTCASHKPDPPVPHQYDSMLMNLMDALAKIDNIFLKR
ncbi:uncharacterized protein LOC128961533 [Oppia nitens]|uniref:uncharacterized protein LOC128961533 n=1 Tax=Oppia nitens TaxID=1686743 RepID=UPI0023DBFCBA|nr:uncharacterized protein LOC128961533 [Oppia nitens]